MTVYPPPPTFTDGQRISASAHLNALTDSAGWLIGSYQQEKLTFERRKENDELAEAGYWHRTFTGYIYHKQDTLAYNFEVTESLTKTGEIRIQYDDTEIVVNPTFGTGAGTATVSGTLDVSAIDVAIVRITVDYRAKLGGTPTDDIGNMDVEAVYLRETQSPSYAAFAAFVDEDTPTAAQWQALSDNANVIYAQLIAPAVPLPGLVQHRDRGVIATIWEGLITHNHERFFYDIRMRTPTNLRDPAHDYVNSNYEIWIDLYGTDIFHGGAYVVSEELDDNETSIIFYGTGQKLANGDVITEAGEKILLGGKSGDTFASCTRGYDGSTARWHVARSQWDIVNPDAVDTAILGDADDNWDVNYSGVADISGLSLVEGTDYVVRVRTYQENHAGEDSRATCMVGLLSEQTEDIGISAWVEPMITWSHGDYVIGDDGVKRIRDNLSALSGKAVYHNYPCSKAHTDASLWGVYRHRWLMYRHAEDTKPMIGYDGGPTDGWSETTLPTEPNKWMAFDLDSLKNFWAGMRYKLSEVEFAIEDLVPYAES
jgi:hypothetical protein